MQKLTTLLRRRLHSLGAAIATWPTRTDWYRCGLLYAAYSGVALTHGLRSQFARPEWTREPLPAVAALPVILFVLPGITEEVIFRGLLLPHPHTEAASAGARSAAALGSLGLFVLWHPLQAPGAHPAARATLTDPRFLVQVALLGTTCTGGYYLSGSIWPPVVMHWLTVTVWMLALGGWQAGQSP